MIYLYFVPILVIGAVVFERVTDPSRIRRRAIQREYVREYVRAVDMTPRRKWFSRH
jgi:hypothetical protein